MYQIEFEIRGMPFLQQHIHIDGLVQDCSNTSALAKEYQQSCTKSSTYKWQNFFETISRYPIKQQTSKRQTQWQQN